MESGFVSEIEIDVDDNWNSTQHQTDGRFEFQKLRSYGALYFVKRPKKEYRHDLLTLESLNKEFSIGSNLSHPSIVRYLKKENDTIFEEYIDGLSLREMIDSNDRRLQSPQFIQRLCKDLLEAVAYLHQNRVIHNDIKPENVMITRIADQVKLVDLGCATTDMWDVAEGFTPKYKAPEQGCEATNTYTDIYLIGRLMEELAPIAGVSPEWEEFINKATFKNAKFRFLSAKEALKALPSRKWKEITYTIVFLVFFLGFWFLFNYFTSDFHKWLFSHIFSIFK